MSRLVLTVVGARPQFIKAAPVSRALIAGGISEKIVHTGQHYDALMSDIFFERLNIPLPSFHLGVGSGLHGAQTGRILEKIEEVFRAAKPDLVLVYGDTNSTLAGALAAAKLHVPVAHVEAGLRSFNRKMPEEINRIVTDHTSTLLFTPSDAGLRNLEAEGIRQGVFRTGDVMYDTAILFRDSVGEMASAIPARFGVTAGEYALATVHRAENTDDPQRWNAILKGFRAVSSDGLPIVWPVHPRTRSRVTQEDLDGVHLVDPLPYFELQALLMHARVVLTDSGGVQKEAAFHSKPCITLRDETEWVELVSAGVNRLSGADAEKIRELVRDFRWPETGLPPVLYGDGHAADDIVKIINEYMNGSGG